MEKLSNITVYPQIEKDKALQIYKDYLNSDSMYTISRQNAQRWALHHRQKKILKKEFLKSYYKGEIKKISESELLVMSVLWLIDQPMRGAEIAAFLQQTLGLNWKLTTVSTFLSRLREKGYTYCMKVGIYSYWDWNISKNSYRFVVTYEMLQNFYSDYADLGSAIEEIRSIGTNSTQTRLEKSVKQ